MVLFRITPLAVRLLVLRSAAGGSHQVLFSGRCQTLSLTYVHDFGLLSRRRTTLITSFSPPVDHHRSTADGALRRSRGLKTRRSLSATSYIILSSGAYPLRRSRMFPSIHGLTCPISASKTREQSAWVRDGAHLPICAIRTTSLAPRLGPDGLSSTACPSTLMETLYPRRPRRP